MMTRIKKCIPYFQRAIASLYASVLGAALAGCLIWMLVDRFKDQPSFARGAAYGGLSGLILFGLRHAELVWKQIVAIFNYIADNSSASDIKSERIKGRAFQVKAGVASFFISAPIFLTILILSHSNSEQFNQAPSPTEFIYVWAIEKSEPVLNPTYTLHAPYLVFKPGALSQQGWENHAGSWKEVDSGWFEDLSLQLSEQQRNHLKSHLLSLQRSCRTFNQPINVETWGFASESPFLDRERNRRPDSEQLNLAIANLRARSVASTIDELVSAFELREPKFEISAVEWKNITEMQQYRDEEFFQKLSISFSPHTDHRSVALRLGMHRGCQIVSSDRGDQVLAVRD